MFHSSFSRLSDDDYVDNEALTRLLQTSFCFWLLYHILVVFDSFLLQILPDIVHPCCRFVMQSFLVSRQAVTSPLLLM